MGRPAAHDRPNLDRHAARVSARSRARKSLRPHDGAADIRFQVLKIKNPQAIRSLAMGPRRPISSDHPYFSRNPAPNSCAEYV